MNEDSMIEFGGTYYHLNFEAMDKLLTYDDKLIAREISENEIKILFDKNNDKIGEEHTTKTYEKAKEIDTTRYDVLRMCLEVILNFNEAVDDELGSTRALKGTPLSFRVAFNTLLKYNILKAIT